MPTRPVPRLAIVALGFALVSSSASAVPLTFNGRAAFNLAVGSTLLEDFEEANVAPGSFVVTTGPLSASTNTGVFSTGDIVPGLSIIDNPASPSNLAVLGVGAVAGTTKAVGPGSLLDSLDLLFAPTVSAAGFDLFFASGIGAPLSMGATITVYDALNSVLFSTTQDFSGISFFGVSNAPIARINISSTLRTVSEFVDNVAISSPAADAVPEPASLLLFGSGLVGAAVRRRMKK